jgi:exopolysaccharide production protein ExoZ
MSAILLLPSPSDRSNLRGWHVPEQDSQTLTSKLYGIQYLRGFAALAVVIFHAAERTGYHFTIGAAGVDVFFVISGFIMWIIADGRSFTPGRFLADRLKRIAPSYWIVTAIMVVGGLAGLFPNLVITWKHVIASFLFIPHQSPSRGEVWPVLVQGWTLNYEMFFYTVFAATLLLPRNLRLPSMTAVFGVFALAGVLFEPEGSVTATYTRPIIVEFLVGAFIGKWWLEGSFPRAAFGALAVLAGLGGFALIAITGAGFDELICGPLAASLVIGVLALEKKSALIRSRRLTYLGDSSYSVYLWHTLAISVVAKFGAMFAVPKLVLLVAAVASGVALGIAAYELIEKPVAKMLNGDFPWPQRKAVLQGSAGRDN